MSPQLTILTDPVPDGRWLAYERARRGIRAVRDRLRPPPPRLRSRYRGHAAVTRSLLDGLQGIGVEANYNPTRLRHIAPVIGVLSGVPALRQAIWLKRRGLIKRILAGPNIINFPSEARAIITSPEVDVCITPSAPVCTIYLSDTPMLDGRCRAWPAGVDTDYWHANDQCQRDKRALVYLKLTGVAEDYIRVAEQLGYDCEVIKYGEYTPDEYRKKLQTASVLIGFSASESQGIAWAEAWSCNVPTLIWRGVPPLFRHHLRGLVSFETSPAPYLSAATGAFFSTPDELTVLLSDLAAGNTRYEPRPWVDGNMSDGTIARKYCELAEIDVP